MKTIFILLISIANINSVLAEEFTSTIVSKSLIEDVPPAELFYPIYCMCESSPTSDYYFEFAYDQHCANDGEIRKARSECKTKGKNCNFYSG